MIPPEIKPYLYLCGAALIVVFLVVRYERKKRKLLKDEFPRKRPYKGRSK